MVWISAMWPTLTYTYYAFVMGLNCVFSQCIVIKYKNLSLPEYEKYIGSKNSHVTRDWKL